MTLRKQLAYKLVDWVGADRLQLIQVGSGWPSHFKCQTETGSVILSAHLGNIGLSKRKRDAYERRFQNPGQGCPVLAEKDEFPILLGFAEVAKKRVLVGMDGIKRLNRATRQSLFMPVNLLTDGIAKGWAEHESTVKERIVAFLPPLLPFFVEVYREGHTVSTKEVRAALKDAGVKPLPPDA